MKVQEITSEKFKCFHIVENYRRAAAELSEMTNNVFYFNRLIVDEKIRNKGCATALMQRVVKWADQEKTTIILDINSYGDLDYNRLLTFYLKYGFKFKNKKTKTLIRIPI